MSSATLRTLATILGTIAIAYFVGSIVLGTVQDTARKLDSYSSPSVTCVEDMECWDCSTMGNLICGPNS